MIESEQASYPLDKVLRLRRSIDLAYRLVLHMGNSYIVSSGVGKRELGACRAFDLRWEPFCSRELCYATLSSVRDTASD